MFHHHGRRVRPALCSRLLAVNYVSKLSVFYERDLGIVSDWSNNLRTENSVRSASVTSYIVFSQEKQKKAGVTVK